MWWLPHTVDFCSATTMQGMFSMLCWMAKLSLNSSQHLWGCTIELKRERMQCPVTGGDHRLDNTKIMGKLLCSVAASRSPWELQNSHTNACHACTAWHCAHIWLIGLKKTISQRIKTHAPPITIHHSKTARAGFSCQQATICSFLTDVQMTNKSICNV